MRTHRDRGRDRRRADVQEWPGEGSDGEGAVEGLAQRGLVGGIGDADLLARPRERLECLAPPPDEPKRQAQLARLGANERTGEAGGTENGKRRGGHDPILGTRYGSGVAVKAKTFAYEIALDREGLASAEDAAPRDFGEEWTPEHLVLAGLARCSVTSLRYFAKQRGIAVEAEATASGKVTAREDGRYGFVELEVRIALELNPVPEDLRTLLERAEWGCFVGASLTPKPTYSWRVNGNDAR